VVGTGGKHRTESRKEGYCSGRRAIVYVWGVSGLDDRAKANRRGSGKECPISTLVFQIPEILAIHTNLVMMLEQPQVQRYIHTMSIASNPKALAVITIEDLVYNSSCREEDLNIEVSAQPWRQMNTQKTGKT
jgi:hypothetical protein